VLTAPVDLFENIQVGRTLAIISLSYRKQAIPEDDSVAISKSPREEKRSSRRGTTEHLRHVQPRDRRIHLPSHVDVHLRGLVALVPHERLQRVRRELARVHRGERSAEIVEAIDEGEPPMPMLLRTQYWTERDRLFAAASGPRLRSGFGFPRTLSGRVATRVGRAERQHAWQRQECLPKFAAVQGARRQ